MTQHIMGTQLSHTFNFVGLSKHSSVVLQDGSVLVLGGSTGDGTSYSNEVWKSSDGGMNWTRLTIAAWGTGCKYFVIISYYL